MVGNVFQIAEFIYIQININIVDNAIQHANSVLVLLKISALNVIQHIN